MKTRLKIPAAILLAGLLSLSLAQIGQDPQSVLAALGPQDVRQEAGGYQSGELQFDFVLQGGAVYRVTGESVLSEAGIERTAALVGAATGYGPSIAEPVAQFLASDRLADMAGRGPVPLGVEEYLLELELEGDAPYRLSFTLGLQEVPGDLFPESRHALGPADAPYVIREFSDFQCPFCARYATQVLPSVKRELLARGDVRFEFHHFPLVSIHANAQLAAEAAECVTAANGPEAFWTYHDALFARQQAWQGLGDPAAYFARLAQDLGLSSEGVAACLDARTYAAEVQAAYQTAAGSLRLTGTPTVFLNGYKLADFNDLNGYLRAMGWVDAFAE